MPPLDDLVTIYRAAIERVDPYRMIVDQLSLEGEELRVPTEGGELRLDLGRFRRIIVIGTGKATAKMALGIEEKLRGRIAAGLIAVKRGHTERLGIIRTIEAGHPVPDEESIRAGREIRELCRDADETTLFINLISGGGSACLCLPKEWEEQGDRRSITLAEKQAVTGALLACGAEIGEINCVRKHLSDIKGGGLARICSPGTSLNLILSDVVGDRLDAIASGLAVGDSTTYEDALAVLRRYHIEQETPKAVRHLLELGAAGKVMETPKPGDPIFERVHSVLLGSNLTALGAAAKRAVSLGYRVTVLTSMLTGEAREAAKVFAGIGADIERHDLLSTRPACVLAGGETTVTLRGDGKGGRNQELALSFLREIASGETRESTYFLSAGTDGNDGPTDAAGAFACARARAAAAEAGLSIDDYLARNDSYHFFERIGYLFKPGATNTNVGDLQVLIVTSSPR